MLKRISLFMGLILFVLPLTIRHYAATAYSQVTPGILSDEAQQSTIEGQAGDSEESDERETSRQISQQVAGIFKVSPTIKADANSDIDWYDARVIGIEGKAWADTETFYDRLPARAKDRVRPPVWSLSQHSAGMCVRFVTEATTIHARWNLKSKDLAMPHMPATGVSGVDLYVRHREQWRWLATGQPKEQLNTVRLVHQLPPGKREYLLYLPLYNGVTSVELGVPSSVSLWRKPTENKRCRSSFGGPRSRRAHVHLGQECVTQQFLVVDSNARSSILAFPETERWNPKLPS